MRKSVSGEGSMSRTKASYRPMTGAQSPPKRSQITTSQNTNYNKKESSYDEHPNSLSSLSIALSTALEYRDEVDSPLNEYLLKRIAVMKKYLEETGLEEVFHQMCQFLLNREELPYNPYPGFVRRLRPYIEKFHMFRIESDNDVLKMLKSQSQQSNIPHIYNIYNCDHFWGLANIINYVDASVLAPYRNFTMQHLIPASSSLSLEEDYSCQILVALVGPVVFAGTFYSEPVMVSLRLEYLWYGLSVKKGAELFAKSVKSDLQNYISAEENDEDSNSSSTIFLGFFIPNAQSYKSELSSDMLTKLELKTYWEDLDLFIIESVKKQIPITAQLLILLDKSKKIYKKCNKEYYFHFVQLSKSQNDDSQIEKVYNTGDLSFETLHEGVFLRKAYAEAYISIFAQKFESEKRRGKHQSKEHLLPFSKQIIDSLKETWQYQLVHLDREAISHVAHRCLLLFLTEGNKALLVEVYRLLQSKYMELFVCTSINKQLQDLIELAPQKINCIVLYFQQYKRKLLNVLDTKLQECSSNFQSAHDFLQVFLELPLTSASNNDNLLPKILEEIIATNHYCSTLLLQLAEDALANCSSLDNFLDSLDLKLSDGKKDSSVKQSSREEVIFPHGVDYQLNKHDFQFINLERCLKVNKRPSIMAEEGVLLQYVTDTKIDMVWQEFLIDILSDVHLLPNPYPRLISHFRQASLKMELYHTPKKKQSDLLFHHSEKLVDAPSSIYYVPGCDAYGQISALSVLNNTYFQKVAFVAKNLLNTSYAQRIGQLKVCMALAIAGYSALYGNFCPYLTFLELHEHCYIKGPLGFEDEAIYAYTKIVLHHLLSLKSQQNVLLIGLYVGEKLYVSSKDIRENDENFKEDLKRAILGRQTLWIKSYYVVGWRYLEVKKMLLLHFVDNAEDRYESFFLPDPIFLYQEVFLSLEQAVLNFEQRNTENKINSPFSEPNLRIASSYLDEKILKSANLQDLFQFIHLALTRSLIAQSSFCLTEVFRIFHSPAYVLLYLSYLNNALKDLVLMELDANKNKVVVEATANKSKSKQKENSPPKNHVDNLTLSHMATAYHQQLRTVLIYSGSLTPASLLKHVDKKLSKIFKSDPITKDKLVIINHSTVSILYEVDNMLKAVQHALINDMMKICVELPQLLTTVEMPERKSRPNDSKISTSPSKLSNPLEEF